MAHHSQASAELCSKLSMVAAEQAAGTAAEATCWVVLEQDGPWGAKAAVQSRLDPEFGARMEAAVTAVGGRFALMREPGAHPDRHHDVRRVLVAGGPIDAPWLVLGTVDAPERLLQLPLECLSDPSPARILTALPDLTIAARPVMLVCTNGKRDRCCALTGRPVADAVLAAHPGRVMETTHLGGHRFAPTAVLLPTGHTYARLDPENAVAALSAADEGRVPAELSDALHYRGRSCLRRPQQVAEYAFRAARDYWDLPGPTVDDAVQLGQDHWTVRVTSGPDVVTVDVIRSVTDRLRPESCGQPAVPVPEWRTSLTHGVRPT